MFVKVSPHQVSEPEGSRAKPRSLLRRFGRIRKRANTCLRARWNKVKTDRCPDYVEGFVSEQMHVCSLSVMIRDEYQLQKTFLFCAKK
jgi:hypothetical protein